MSLLGIKYKCRECKGELGKPIIGYYSFFKTGGMIDIVNVPFYKCPRCGHEFQSTSVLRGFYDSRVLANMPGAEAEYEDYVDYLNTREARMQ